MPELTMTITQSRRDTLGRLRAFPRAFRRIPSVFGMQPTRSHTVIRWSFWLRVRAAWLLAGVQFRIDGSIIEVI